jgi:hypothetical protein
VERTSAAAEARVVSWQLIEPVCGLVPPAVVYQCLFGYAVIFTVSEAVRSLAETSHGTQSARN